MWQFRLAAVAAVSSWAPCSAGALFDSWNTAVGGNAGRTGFVQALGPAAPAVLWQGSPEAVAAEHAVVHDGVVVTARMASMADVLQGSTIVAHDLVTGEIRWQRGLPVDSLMSDWRTRVMGTSNGLVFATRAGDTNRSYIYALRVTDGSVAWRSADTFDESSTESPAITDKGDLVVGNFSSLVRVSGVDGATAWSAARTSPCTDGSAAAIFNDRVYVWEASLAGPCVTAFDLETGQRLYSSAGIGGGYFQQVGLMVGPDGTVYAPRSQNIEGSDALVALEDTGVSLVERWRTPLGYAPFASMGIGPDGSVYTYAPSRQVVRLDPGDGTIVSRSIAIESDFFQPRMAIAMDGTVYLTNGGEAEGRLYSFNMDLTERWRVPTPGVHMSGPTLASNGVLVVCGTGTNLWAFKTDTVVCAPDWNGDGILDARDLFDFVTAYLAGEGDYNRDGVTNSYDFFEFLSLFVRGC
jgi:outer membrane protein assembly factor BamB